MSNTKNTNDITLPKKKKKKRKGKELTLNFDFDSLDKSIMETSGKSQSKIVEHLLLKETTDIDHKFDGGLTTDLIEQKGNLPQKKSKDRSRRNSLSIWSTNPEEKNKKESKSTETEEKSESTSSITKK